MSESQICILNVDDYVPGRYARTKILQQAGFIVVEAGTGQETLLAVAEHQPSVVLLDVNLPDMNGFEICKKIKDDPQTGAPTIIHISASSVQNYHLVHGLDAGADAYLVEPIDGSVLVATIRAFLRARRAENALRKSNEELQWFAYRAAHDLNDPLRAMVVHTQLLERSLKGQLDANGQKSIDFVMDAGRRMTGLISRLLRYAEVAHGKEGPIKIDCNAMVARVIANLAPAIEKSGAQIVHEPLPVIAADAEIEEVFQNLISNAIKYAREGVTPVIHVSGVAESGGWRFTVRDNGIGIDPVDRDSIFNIFRRLHGSDITGNGIGLAIAKKIVTAHGGEIWAESHPGVGSTFHFTILEDPDARERTSSHAARLQVTR